MHFPFIAKVNSYVVFLALKADISIQKSNCDIDEISCYVLGASNISKYKIQDYLKMRNMS